MINLSSLDYNEIINQEKIVSYFQGLHSVNRKNIIGVEALSRGIDSKGDIISPISLIKYARENNSSIQLERIFRKKSVESFKNFAVDYPDLLFFLNVEVTILPEVIGSGEISKLFKKYNLDPRRVVLEINEEKCDDFLALKKFVNTYRQQGFLIALDDVGKAFSNFNRISSLTPEIIKIDRNIISGIDKDYYQQEILLALCRLARKTGIKIIAEGVETKAELEFLIKSEVDIIQGYIFSAPNPAVHWNKKNNKNIKRLTPFIEKSMQGKVKSDLYKNKKYQIIVKEIINEIKFIKNNKLNQ